MAEHSRAENRSSGMRARLALIVVGLAIGFAARWIGGMLEEQVKEPHFKPMPAASVDTFSDSTAD